MAANAAAGLEISRDILAQLIQAHRESRLVLKEHGAAAQSLCAVAVPYLEREEIHVRLRWAKRPRGGEWPRRQHGLSQNRKPARSRAEGFRRRSNHKRTALPGLQIALAV